MSDVCERLFILVLKLAYPHREKSYVFGSMHFIPVVVDPITYMFRAEELPLAPQTYLWFSTEEVSGQNQVKASVQRRIRQSIAEEYPLLEPVLEDLLPKKSPLIVAKCQNHLNLVVVNNVPLFFNIRDGPYMPTLRLLHQYPNIMKKLQVDRGAIKFVLSGANIMCPGLTSPGGALDVEVGAETPVAIMAEGKQHALAIGFTKMSAKDIIPSASRGGYSGKFWVGKMTAVLAKIKGGGKKYILRLLWI
ncbi:hypothetical protein KY285_002572 [Solanum tuberosum]|nr:hypothetical protein KY285_002572 [Solanum tuberosum]